MFFAAFLWASIWSLFTYTVVRLSFLLWNWSTYHNQGWGDLGKAFFFGLRFDISAVSALSILLLILTLLVDAVRARKKFSMLWERGFLALLAILFLVLHLPLLLLNFIDAELINFVGRRFTLDVVPQLTEVPGKTHTYIAYAWPLSLMALVVISIYVWGVCRILRAPLLKNIAGKGALVIKVAVILAFVIGARGGLQTKPINFAHAQEFSVPAMNSLMLNTSFTFIQTLFRESLPREVFFQDKKEMLKLLNGSIASPSWMEGRRFKEKQNVVLIVMESFALEYMERPHGDKGYTPFLDELSQKGILFSNAYANGRRSIEGIGAIFGGIPALMNQPFISSQYLTNYFLGIGTLLTQQKYQTSFFHGAKNGSMYFDQFMHSAGVQNYFGLSEFPKPEESDGSWGIWDEPMMQWMVEKTNQVPQPFFAGLFSLSSHHPFKVPDKYKDQFPKGPAEILQTIGYADFALKKFFESAEKQEWYKNTLFIITADHTSQNFRPEYNNELGRYRVPIILFHPGLQFQGLDGRQVVSHIDIPATIMDFLGLPQNELLYLGKSIFVPGERSTVNYLNGRYMLIMKDHFMVHPQGSAEFKLYSSNDPFERNQIFDQPIPQDQLKKRLQATIQYFSQGLWDNKLYYPPGN